jgi:hypothetical protein
LQSSTGKLKQAEPQELRLSVVELLLERMDNDFRPRTISGWLVVLAAMLIYLGLRWSASSTLFLLNLWRLVRWKPTLVDKGFDRFLLVKIQFEERVTDLAQLLWVTTAVQVTPKLFQLKQPPSGERHNGG